MEKKRALGVQVLVQPVFARRGQRQIDHQLVCGLQVNGMLLEGKKVFVGPFLRRNERSSESEAKFTNVFVKNLDECG